MHYNTWVESPYTQIRVELNKNRPVFSEPQKNSTTVSLYFTSHIAQNTTKMIALSSPTYVHRQSYNFFLRNRVQTQIVIYVRALTPINTRTHTLPLWAPLKDWAGLILRFTKSVIKSTSERLSRFDLEIHEVGHQEHLAVDKDVAFHWKNN
jgi:hypothetical protein